MPTILLWIHSHKLPMMEEALEVQWPQSTFGWRTKMSGEMKQCSVSTRSQHSLEGSGRSPSMPAGTVTGPQRSQQQMLVKNPLHVSIWSGIAKRNLANSPGQPSHAVVMKREIVTLLLLCILCISFSTSKILSVPFSFYLTNVFRCKARIFI